MEQQLSSDQKSTRPDVLQFTILKKYFLSKNLNGFFVYFIASLPFFACTSAKKT